MKKVFTLSVMLFTMVWAANAQTQKGNLMVGADIANIAFSFQEGSNSFDFVLTPKVGFFIKDNLAIGPTVLIGLSTGNDLNTTFDYGIGAFGRYFVSDKETEIIKRSRFFFEASVGFNGRNVEDGPNTNGIGFGFGPGLAWFLTESVGLETLLKYDFTVGFGSSAINNQLSLGVGIQVYIPSKKARQAIKEQGEQKPAEQKPAEQKPAEQKQQE